VNDIINYDVKIRNIRFMGELTKFGIYFENATEKLIENLKQCLDNFHGQNIEIICNLLESCGRFLLNTLDQANLTKLNDLIDLMWRLKEKEKISSRQMSSIEQAYFMCRPGKYRGGRGAAIGGALAHLGNAYRIEELSTIQ